MNIILFGPPGAGKGTQANNIVKENKLYKISTGDLLRKEVENKTELGDKIKLIIKEGQFVSDDIINMLIEKILSNKKYYNNLIFDGCPRNLNQAKNLDILHKKHNQKISRVLSLKVDQEIVIKRIIGRQVCSKCGSIFNDFYYPADNTNHSCGSNFLSKRSDDNERTIVKRFTTYKKETLPILDYYKKQNLLSEIDGMKEIDAIYKEIQQIISTL